MMHREMGGGRGARPGLALFLLLAGCADVGPGPVARPAEDYRAPEVSVESGVRTVANSGAAERLILYDSLPEDGVRLAFLRGRPAALLEDGRSAWPDHDAARVVVFDQRGAVESVLQGRAGGRRLESPAFAAAAEEGVLAVEPDGTALLFDDTTPVRWLDSEGTGAPMGGGRLAASVRTIFDIPLQPLPDDAPLLWLHTDGEWRPLGVAVDSREPLLGSLTNSGWVGVGPASAVYFASAVRPELRRYDADGGLRWISTWSWPGEIRDPRFRFDGGGLSPDFTLVQQALVVGPDGNVYVLTPGGEDGRERVLVFGRDGALLRSGEVAAGSAVYLGEKGHVFVTSAEAALSRTRETLRAEFPAFDLPALDGGESVSLESLRGRPVVVNFWASWCAPCREEMPLLDAFARELEGTGAVVLGVNEDVRPADGVRFLEELGGVSYPILEGGGDQQAVYRYRGLPYTVVLDAEGRIVRTFYGFGTSIDPIKAALYEELEAGT